MRINDTMISSQDASLRASTISKTSTQRLSKTIDAPTAFFPTVGSNTTQKLSLIEERDTDEFKMSSPSNKIGMSERAFGSNEPIDLLDSK